MLPITFRGHSRFQYTTLLFQIEKGLLNVYFLIIANVMSSLKNLHCSLPSFTDGHGWPVWTPIQCHLQPRSINMRYSGDSAHWDSVGLQDETWRLLGQPLPTSPRFRTSMSTKNRFWCLKGGDTVFENHPKCHLSGNTVWPQASGFQKLAKMDLFSILNELLSTQNVNVARFVCNVEWDFFCYFQTHRVF